MLTEDDQDFLKKRQRFVSRGNLAVVSILVLLTGTYTWLWFSSPFLANPFHVARAVQQKTMDPSMLTGAAVILPVVVTGLFATVGLFALLGCVIFHNEKRYLTLIDKLQNLQGTDEDAR